MASSVIEIERVAQVPEHCPTCNRKNADHGIAGSGLSAAIGTGWHPYIHIPEAPAVGCGNCGHVVYVEDQVLGKVKRELRAKHPKIAERKIKFRKGK
jgi:hypothetical protein